MVGQVMEGVPRPSKLGSGDAGGEESSAAVGLVGLVLEAGSLFVWVVEEDMLILVLMGLRCVTCWYGFTCARRFDLEQYLCHCKYHFSESPGYNPLSRCILDDKDRRASCPGYSMSLQCGNKDRAIHPSRNHEPLVPTLLSVLRHLCSVGTTAVEPLLSSRGQ